MGNEINEVGNKYGRLTVIRKATKEEKAGRAGAVWFCQCECGNTITARGFALRQGNIQSCGCLKHERIIESNINRSGGDLTGKQFGKLLVIKLFESKKNNRGQNLRYWECKCECGNILKVTTTALNRGIRTCCDECVKEKLRQDHLVNEIGKKYGLLTVIEYAGQHPVSHQALWKCKCRCGNEKITTGTILRNGDCKSCGCIKSQGEELIKKILIDNNINFMQQFYFSDLRDYNKKRPLPLYFDFAIFNNDKIKCLIEYQGQQHYYSIDRFGGQDSFQDQQYRDQLKRDYCKQHNIKLVEIPYTDLNKITIDYLKEKMNE